MSAPALKVQIDGGPAITGDQLNTYVAWCPNVAVLRGFIGVDQMTIYLQGISSPNDGGQGSFYWNASGTAPDDNGTTTVIPTGSVAGSGEWTRVSASSSLPDISNNTVLANISGETDAPVATTLTALIDSAIGNTQGSILYRGDTQWSSLPPGTSGNVLTTLGSAENPEWLSNTSSSIAVQGTFKNLKGIWVSNTTATYTIDQIVLQNSSIQPILSTLFSETLNTALTGAGGLDTGSLAASTWYCVYAIQTSTLATQNILFSTSATNPTLPAGYTFFARIGSFRTDGSKNILGFIQYARDITWIVGDNLASLPLMATGAAGSVTTPTWVGIPLANFCPPTASGIKLVLVSNTDTPSIAAPNNSYGGVGSLTNPPPIGLTFSGAAGGGGSIYGEFSIEGSDVYWASAGTNSSILTYGYTDNL